MQEGRKRKQKFRYIKKQNKTTITKKVLNEKTKSAEKKKTKTPPPPPQNRTQDFLQAGPFRCYYATSKPLDFCRTYGSMLRTKLWSFTKSDFFFQEINWCIGSKKKKNNNNNNKNSLKAFYRI